ncbi:MAG: META domain-containing protein [Candidatus Electrothrix sp. AR4]|nr:META domain-containing protein [Candidatus Electrothrix sp. AR4]
MKVLRASGGIMSSLERYEFVQADSASTSGDVVQMQGMYSCLPEGGIFRECLSGVSFPVARGGERSRLEQTCLDKLHGQEKPVFVTLEARLSFRRGRGESLVPVRLIDIDPARLCDGEESGVLTITDNRWRLMEINGEKLEPDSVQKTPFLKVKSRDNVMQGFSGCNRFSGTWLFKEKNFLFSRAEATRVACPLGMEVEDAFLSALENTQSYQIKDGILALFDRHGKMLARLRHASRLTEDDSLIPPPPVASVGLDQLISCGKSWKTPLTKLKGKIKKIEYRSPPWIKEKGLLLDVETSPGTYFVIHVFPEKLIRQCPEQFGFELGEEVIVTGSEFRTGKGGGQRNICAATITQGSKVLSLRDPATSALDRRGCGQAFCRKQCAGKGKPKRCMDRCMDNW